VVGAVVFGWLFAFSTLVYISLKNDKSMINNKSKIHVEIKDNDWEHFYLTEGGVTQNIYVDFKATCVCVDEGYQIHYPVDNAHDEPATYSYSVELLSETASLVFINVDGEEDLDEDFELKKEQDDAIEQYINENLPYDNYENEDE
jgi:hypothetical protein